jgi:hypothetical protein
MHLRRLFGFPLIIAAVVGFIFSVVGLVEIWRYRPVVTQRVLDTLALFNQTLKTTQDGLVVVGNVVQTTTASVASLHTTTQAMAQAVHDTSPMLDSLTSLTGEDLPTTISSTQTSLASAQSSALLIDNVMAALASIPLLSLDAYKPAVPLHTALAEVSTSLDSLPPSLATITTSLEDGKANLAAVETELNNVADTTKEISDALSGAQTVIDQYKTATAQLKAQVVAAQAAAPGWMMATAWILSFVLGWILVTQLGLCAQGLDMLRDRYAAE